MNILVADDHAIVRKGLVDLLMEEYPSAQITGVANGREVIEQIEKTSWSVILLDISMPGRDGIDTLKQLRTSGIKTPILMLSAFSEDQFAIRVLKAGASGYLSKESATEELLTAVKRVLSGHKYISPRVADKLADRSVLTTEKPAHELLSDRELQVLRWIVSGKTLSEIANEISLSVNTISTYRTRILAKLTLSNNIELTRYAVDHGIGLL